MYCVRVRPAPGNVEQRKSDDPDTDIITNEIGEPIIDKPSSLRRPVPRLPIIPETVKDKPVSSEKPEENSAAPRTTEEFIIEKLEKLERNGTSSQRKTIRGNLETYRHLFSAILKSRKAKNVTRLLELPPYFDGENH